MTNFQPEGHANPGLEGRYTIEYLLGTGGGGRVYRAKQRSTGQIVAVKLLDSEAGLSQEAVHRRKERFRREMTICGRLAHQDIVRLLDFGESADSLFSVFEFVPGQTLGFRLQTGGALPVADSLKIATQLLKVLAYSHAQGVIHRDLKPSNLMVTEDADEPRIKVLDFGISAMPNAFSGTNSRLTLTNEMVGTPAYAAPEQLRGDGPAPRTDLYSWGLILLECLTGKNPMMDASLGEIFARQLSPAPVDLPPALQQHPLGVLLRRVLEKDPSRRAASAAEVLRRLGGISCHDLENEAGYFGGGLLGFLRDSQPALTRTLPTSARHQAERMNITTLCCRLVLKSATSAVEPVLLDAYRNDLFSLCQSTVESFGGTWVGGAGDDALFCFGVSRARDTDSRVALRAAFEVSNQVRARSAVLKAQSQVTVILSAGLHTGALTADERTSGTALAHGVIASTAVAIASRNTRDANDSSVMTSGAFRAVAERYGRFSEAGTLELSWSSQPLAVHMVTGESLFDVFARNGAPFVGRERELEALVNAWERSARQAQTVYIQGEAGIGKSRLIYEFAQRISEAGRTGMTLRCQPELQALALGPVRELVIDSLGLEGGFTTCESLADVLSDFELGLDTAIPLLCSWLSVRISAPYAPLPHSPQMQLGMLIELLTSLVRQLAQRKGYLIVEDLHWADHRTMEWLGRYLKAIDGWSGLLLVTSRPDVTWQWDSNPSFVLPLGNLSDADVRALVTGLPAAAHLSETVVSRIRERADGVPLFVEELTRAFMRLSDLEFRDVPATLRDLLSSRLDELGPAKETAQFAAAIGREFEVDLLCFSASKDEATVLADVDQLVSAGLLVVRRRLDRESYLFRHALIRDAAYDSLTPADARTVHGAIADALIGKFPDQVQARPDTVAFHCESAGRLFEAQQYWLLSGRKAMGDVAYDEARNHFERGLRLVRKCSETEGFHDAELVQLNALLAANVVKFGFGAPELPAILQQAQLSMDAGHASKALALPLLWGQYLFNTVRPNFTHALPIAQRILDIAASVSDRTFMLVGHSALIRCAFWMGDFRLVDAYEAAIDELYDARELRQLLEVTGEDPYMAAASFAGLCAIVRGDAAQGISILERLVHAEERVNVPGLIQGTQAQLAFGYILRGMAEPGGTHLEMARELAVRAKDDAMRLGFPFWAGYAGLMESMARIYQGDRQAVEQAQGTMQMFVAAGADIGFGWNHSSIAFGLLQRGEFDLAEANLAAARRHEERGAEGFFAAQRVRFEGHLLRARGASAKEVSAKLTEAIELARIQDATLFASHAQADLTSWLC